LPTAAPAHGAIAFAVHVNVRLPAAMSPALGVYVVLADDALANVPVPFVDHVPPAELDEPAETATGPDVEHVVYGPPALLVGGACTTRATVLLDVVPTHASVMSTWYEPASAPPTDAIVYDAPVAPPIAVVPWYHW
jgi:hypothetical protein